MKTKVIDLLEELCDESYDDISIYDEYSGKGMFGCKCLGISCEKPIKVIEKAAQKGLEGANYDQIGLNYIVYWPKYNLESEIDAVELVELRDIEDEE